MMTQADLDVVKRKVAQAWKQYAKDLAPHLRDECLGRVLESVARSIARREPVRIFDAFTHEKARCVIVDIRNEEYASRSAGDIYADPDVETDAKREREIVAAMKAAGGRVLVAAQSLGVSRAHLFSELQHEKYAHVDRAPVGRPKKRCA